MLILIGLLALLAVAMVVAGSVGAVPVRPRAIVSMLIHGLFGGSASGTSVDETIVFQIRLPRVIAAALVGAALSVAGVLFQGLFRNPMADPYVIGSQGGAALGATIGILLLPHFSFLGFGATATLAFLGSVLAMVLVYWLARVGGRTPIVGLLLAGFALSTLLSSSTVFFMFIGPQTDTALRALTSWLHGTVAVAGWDQILAVAAMVLVGILCSLPLARMLNALSLGEEYAEQLGIPIEWSRAAIILVGSLLTSGAVSVGGLIGFVGLIVPHFCRLLLGPEHLRLIPVSALCGATFLVLADTLARTVIAPSELPVGILTAFIGGPAFLYLLRRTKREYVG
ncbi:MAG TPA: iron ABC transporter permease [Candidatus Angelobacter sp.]|nr:iron ABC transporter permease [Candidatus Angelobacter sp.]